MAASYQPKYQPLNVSKRDEYFRKLCLMRKELQPSYQGKITEKHLLDLASCLVDGTVFDIVRELEEIQQLNERSLLTKRVKIVSELKAKKFKMAKRHQQELSENSHKLHNIPLLKERHARELSEYEKYQADEVRSIDQEIILELDQMVTEQQSTLHQADLPLFTVSNSPNDIQLQMHLLKFITQLSTGQSHSQIIQ